MARSKSFAGLTPPALGRCARSIIHVNVADAGRYWLEMLCLCSPTQRQFGVACDLRFIASRRLPAAKKQVTPTTVRIDLPLTIGSHEIELHFFNWQKKYGDSRLLAVGFTDVCLKRKFALVGKKSFFSNVFRRFRTRRKVF